MKRWIERVLNIQPGDLGRGTLLCSCLFLIISSYVTGRIARDALFLARFQAVQLPYADITIVDLSQLRTGPIDDPIRTMILNANGAQVRTVIVDGRTVVENGAIPGQGHFTMR